MSLRPTRKTLIYPLLAALAAFGSPDPAVAQSGEWTEAGCRKSWQEHVEAYDTIKTDERKAIELAISADAHASTYNQTSKVSVCGSRTGVSVQTIRIYERDFRLLSEAAACIKGLSHAKELLREANSFIRDGNVERFGVPAIRRKVGVLAGIQGKVLEEGTCRSFPDAVRLLESEKTQAEEVLLARSSKAGTPGGISPPSRVSRNGSRKPERTSTISSQPRPTARTRPKGRPRARNSARSRPSSGAWTPTRTFAAATPAG